jgi:hypothetical protein
MSLFRNLGVGLIGTVVLLRVSLCERLLRSADDDANRETVSSSSRRNKPLEFVKPIKSTICNT